MHLLYTILSKINVSFYKTPMILSIFIEKRIRESSSIN